MNIKIGLSCFGLAVVSTMITAVSTDAAAEVVEAEKSDIPTAERSLVTKLTETDQKLVKLKHRMSSLLKNMYVSTASLKRAKVAVTDCFYQIENLKDNFGETVMSDRLSEIESKINVYMTRFADCDVAMEAAAGGRVKREAKLAKPDRPFLEAEDELAKLRSKMSSLVRNIDSTIKSFRKTKEVMEELAKTSRDDMDLLDTLKYALDARLKDFSANIVVLEKGITAECMHDVSKELAEVKREISVFAYELACSKL